METRFQTSFIPKKPVDTGAIKPSGDVNLLLLLSIIVFIITGSAAGGVYLYQFSLKKEIAEKDADLKNAQKSFGIADIEELKSRSQHLIAAKALLSGHLAPTTLFSFLEEHTLKAVRLKDFDLKVSGGTVSLVMAGEAAGFNALAYQSEVFTGLNKDFLSPTFSEFSLQDDGDVDFKFETAVNPALLQYKNTLTSGEFLPGSGDNNDELF